MNFFRLLAFIFVFLVFGSSAYAEEKKLKNAEIKKNNIILDNIYSLFSNTVGENLSSIAISELATSISRFTAFISASVDLPTRLCFFDTSPSLMLPSFRVY